MYNVKSIHKLQKDSLQLLNNTSYLQKNLAKANLIFLRRALLNQLDELTRLEHELTTLSAGATLYFLEDILKAAEAPNILALITKIKYKLVELESEEASMIKPLNPSSHVSAHADRR